MSVIDQLKETPDEYQLKYCWARAVEWAMFPAFASQPILPVLYFFYPWKIVLIGLICANFIWNLVFCTALVSLPIAAAGMLWSRLKWLSMIGMAGYFTWQHKWLLLFLTAFTPIVAAIAGQLAARRPIALIQEFFMLQLGHVKTEPSPEVEHHLNRGAGPPA